MSIAYGGLVAFLFRGVNLLVAFGTVLFTSRQLAAGDYGIFVLGLTVVGLVTASTGGLTAAVAYQVANQRRAPGTVLLNAGLVAVAIGAVALAVGALGARLVEGTAGQLALPVAFAGAAVILNGTIGGVFLGREQFIRYNLALVLPPLAALISVAVTFLAFDGRTPARGLAAFAAGNWVAIALLVAPGGRQLFAGARLERRLALAVATFTGLAAVSSAVSYLNYRADLFIVQHFEGEASVATYSLSAYIAESIWQVSGSLALATYARLGTLSRAEAAVLTARVMRHTLVLVGIGCAVLAAMAAPLEAFLFGDKYEGMATALQLRLPGVLIFGLAAAFAGFYTYQRGQPWMSAVIAGFALVCDIVFALLFVPPFGINGAAIATSIAYSAAVIAALAHLSRTEGIPPLAFVRFGRAEVADYRALAGRVRALLVR
jgi:O-antigen/teichoic acid export membrane protein